MRKQGRPRIDKNELRGKNDARAELTKKARFSAFVSTSLQPCSLKHNQAILERICGEKAEEKKNKIKGLLAVLRHLQSEHITQDGMEYETSFLSFDDAMEIYFAYQDVAPPFGHHDKDNFTYALLHQDWGLCVYIVYFKRLNKRFIILRPDDCSLEVFLDMICSSGSIVSPERVELDAEKVQSILQTVDTEWDRKVSRVLLSANRSRSEINQLGIDPDNIRADIAKVCF